MKRSFARVKGVAHSFFEDVPDVSLCGAKRSSRTKLYDEVPRGTKKCDKCEKLWKKAEKDRAVVIEMQEGDRIILKSGVEYIVEEVDAKNIYCRKVRKNEEEGNKG